TGPVTKDFKVAQIPFQIDTVRLNDPDGGTTEDARVGLQGNLKFDLSLMSGLQLGVSGVNYAFVDEKGVTLTGVNASFTFPSFTLAGVTFEGSLGAAYNPTGNVFGGFGSLSVTTPDKSLQNFQITLNTLTVAGGSVTAFHATLNGTIQANAIWGLQIKP